MTELFTLPQNSELGNAVPQKLLKLVSDLSLQDKVKGDKGGQVCNSALNLSSCTNQSPLNIYCVWNFQTF